MKYTKHILVTLFGIIVYSDLLNASSNSTVVTSGTRNLALAGVGDRCGGKEMKSCGEGLGCVRPGHKREFFTQDKTMPGICRRLGEEGTRCNPHAQGKAKCMNALSCFPRPASGRNVGVCVNPYNRLIKITLSDSNQNHGINATLPSSTKTVSKSTESTATKSTSILATSTSILGSSSGVAGTPTIHSTYPKDPGLNQTCGGKDRIKCGLDLLCVYPSHDRISTSFGVCRKKGEIGTPCSSSADCNTTLSCLNQTKSRTGEKTCQMDKGRVVSSPLGQICGGPRKLQCENGLECAREGNIHRGDEHSKLNKKVFGICKRRGQVGTSCGPTFPWSCDPGLVCKHKVQGDSGLCIIQGQNATRTLPKPLNDSQKPIIQSETSQKVEKKTACSSSHPCEVGYICTPNGLDPSEEQGTCQRAGTLGTPCMIGSEHPPCDSRLVCSLTQSGLTVGIGICQERSSKHILDDKMMKSVVESSVRRTSNLEVVLDSPKLHKGRRRGKYVRKLHRRIFPKR